MRETQQTFERTVRRFYRKFDNLKNSQMCVCVCVYEMSVDKMTLRQIVVDNMFADKMTINKMTMDEMNVDELL